MHMSFYKLHLPMSHIKVDVEAYRFRKPHTAH